MTTVIHRRPHAGQPVLWRGAPLSSARLALILVHGRGASASDILVLADELRLSDVAFIAPQAAGHTWYPRSFLAPLDQNEPNITSAMEVLAELLEHVEHEGVSANRTGLVGFSQGACLVLEFAARHARRYAGIAGLSGGLIGPPGTPRDYTGSLEGTPVFLGCSDVDPHIPLYRVHETAQVFRRLGAEVDERIYHQMDHGVNEDEIEAVRAMFAR